MIPGFSGLWLLWNWAVCSHLSEQKEVQASGFGTPEAEEKNEYTNSGWGSTTTSLAIVKYLAKMPQAQMSGQEQSCQTAAYYLIFNCNSPAVNTARHPPRLVSKEVPASLGLLAQILAVTLFNSVVSKCQSSSVRLWSILFWFKILLLVEWIVRIKLRRNT